MNHPKEYTKRVAGILLETGALLMSCGASTGRIRITVNRISEALGFQAELMVTHRALMLTISDDPNDTANGTEHLFSRIKRTSPHGVNFRIVSGISHLSWNVADNNWDIDQIEEELERLQALPHYPRLLLLTLVSLAGSSFCYLFGGGYIEMMVTFTASFIGLFVRQETMKRKYNPYICVYLAALTASLISGLAEYYGIGDHPAKAFATSVLFLVPGIPLINSFTDLIDGNILNGLVRGINGFLIAFAIALGLLTVKIIFQF